MTETGPETGPENDSYGDYSVDADDQMTVEDTLDGDDVTDALDRGYSPPEHWSAAQGFGNTAYEEARGETFDQRLAQEEPDVDAEPVGRLEREVADGPTDEQWQDTDPDEVGDVRAGRLVAPDQGLGEDTEKDLVGDDVGIDGAAASAEEAAVHVVADTDLDTGI